MCQTLKIIQTFYFYCTKESSNIQADFEYQEKYGKQFLNTKYDGGDCTVWGWPCDHACGEKPKYKGRDWCWKKCKLECISTPGPKKQTFL